MTRLPIIWPAALFRIVSNPRNLAILAALGMTSSALAPGSVLAAQKPASSKTSGSSAHGGGSKSSEASDPIDINAASVEALTDLPGIGKATAQRIVDYRKQSGPFKTVDELLSVKGIGEKSLARIRDRITVGSGGKN